MAVKTPTMPPSLTPALDAIPMPRTSALNGQTPQPLAPEWLQTERTIWQTAPDADTAQRQLLAAALGRLATLEAQIVTLEAQLWEAGQPRPVARSAPLRPAILALLQTRAIALTRPQIEEAMSTTRPLTETLRKMVQVGVVTLSEGRYALPDAAAPDAAKRPTGRPRKAA